MAAVPDDGEGRPNESAAPGATDPGPEPDQADPCPLPATGAGVDEDDDRWRYRLKSDPGTKPMQAEPGATDGGCSPSAAPVRQRGPHVRTENVNLHTTFPRRYRLLKLRFQPTIIAVGLVAGLSLIARSIGWRYLIAQTIVVGVPLLALAIYASAPWPETGSALQRIKQHAGANSWLYDGYQALRSPPGLAVRGVIVPLVIVLGSGLTGRLADTYWPGRWGPALAVTVFVIGLGSLPGWIDRVGRDLGRRRSPALPEQVKRLSMVQALSWTSLPRYPHEGRGPQRPLLFLSSFNEGLDGYVGGFVEGMQQTLNGPWGQAPRFPRVADGFRPFLEYVDRTSHPIDHSFLAYPHLSVTDVRNALHLERTYRSLRAAHRSDALTRADYEQFLDRVRLSLAALPLAPQLDPQVPPIELCTGTTSQNADAKMTSTARTETTIFLSVLPFECSARHDVLDAIAGLELTPTGQVERERIYHHARSPFNQVTGTHTARLLVVDEWRHPADPRRRTRPKLHFEDGRTGDQPTYDWLVFSAQFDNTSGDAGIGDWLGRAHAKIDPATVEKIWGPAADLVRPSLDVRLREHFCELITETVREPTVRVVDHEQNTVWDVLRAVHTHRVVTQHLVTARDPYQQLLTATALLPHRKP